MGKLEHPRPAVHTERYSIMAPIPPFVDIILQYTAFSQQDYARVAQMASSYSNDPRLIEMVRKAGDASAKVPYLMDTGETAHSILEILREVAQPHVDALKRMPEPIQACIHTLLSINMLPTGYEIYGIPALLEINRMQVEITRALKDIMVVRVLAQQFHEDNKAALQSLDQDWPHVRKGHSFWPFIETVPAHPQMQYIPVFYKGYLVSLREVCVIVDAPDARTLRSLTPPVLHNPLSEHEHVPVTGSADWLIRVVGKIGRHFTRALLEIITRRLDAEKIHVDARNHALINLRAQEALRQFVEDTP